MSSNPRAKGLIRTAGKMNRTEAAYAGELDMLKHAGEVHAYWFEPFNLRLAERCYYKPDFLVQMDDGMLEVHEVKGHWEDDALVRIKVAAEKFPFRFIAIQRVKKKDGGGWKVRQFSQQEVES